MQSVAIKDLGNAIYTVQTIINQLQNKEEICISDLEHRLYEWRATLYKETLGDSINVNDHFSLVMIDDNQNTQEYRFEWPTTAMEPIRSIYASKNTLYACSASVLDLEHYRGMGTEIIIPPSDATTVCLGYINAPAFKVQSSKTNIKEIS